MTYPREDLPSRQTRGEIIKMAFQAVTQGDEVVFPWDTDAPFNPAPVGTWRWVLSRQVRSDVWADLYVNDTSEVVRWETAQGYQIMLLDIDKPEQAQFRFPYNESSVEEDA